MISLITTLKTPQNHRAWSIDWHPTLSLLACVGQSRNITIYKQTSQKQQISTQHLKTIRSIKFSNKGDKLAVCSFDSLISIYILNQGSYQYLTQLQGHENQVKSISWHCTDLKLATCSRDKNIWIWGFNPTTYEYQCENVLEGHSNDVKYVEWIDYNSLASCSYDDTIKIWMENDEDYQILQEIKMHQSIVWATNNDQKGYMVSVGSDMVVGVYKRDEDNMKFTLINRVERVHEEPIYSCLINYPYVITASGDNTIKLIKFPLLPQSPTKQQIQQNKQKHEILQTVYHNNDVNCIRWKKMNNEKYQKNQKNQSDKYLMASCSDDGEIKIWQVELSLK